MMDKKIFELPSAADSVREALVDAGLETPMQPFIFQRSEADRRAAIAEHVRGILEQLGVDASSAEFAETPMRVAKMYLHETFAGMDYLAFPTISFSEVSAAHAPLVLSHGIEIMSQCAHHLVVIDGQASVGYYPKHRLIGLSKINRVIRFFARRPQLQERLTAQCYVALQTLLETEDVAIRIQAKHYCIKARGVRDVNAETTTILCGGVFAQDLALRQSFLGGHCAQ